MRGNNVHASEQGSKAVHTGTVQQQPPCLACAVHGQLDSEASQAYLHVPPALHLPCSSYPPLQERAITGGQYGSFTGGQYGATTGLSHCLYLLHCLSQSLAVSLFVSHYAWLFLFASPSLAYYSQPSQVRYITVSLAGSVPDIIEDIKHSSVVGS